MTNTAIRQPKNLGCKNQKPKPCDRAANSTTPVPGHNSTYGQATINWCEVNKCWVLVGGGRAETAAQVKAKAMEMDRLIRLAKSNQAGAL